MHVVKFFDKLGLTPDIEIVRARLPELREIVGLSKWKCELLRGRFLAWLAAEASRNALLQDLHDGGGSSRGRLADQQVNVIGHDHVACEGEAVAVAHLAQNLGKQILACAEANRGSRL